MEVLLYNVSAASYPRYDYSQRHVISVLKRFKVLMKQLKLDSSKYDVPDHGDVEVFVVQDKDGRGFVDDSFLELKKNEKDKLEFKGKFSFQNIEELVDKRDITEISSRIIVVCVGSLKDTVSYRKFSQNTVLVVEDEVLESQTNDTIGEDQEVVVTKKNLSNAVNLVLERIVFRKMRELVPVLSALSSVAKNEHVGDAAAQQLQAILKLFLQNNNGFRRWLKELDSTKNPELAEHISQISKSTQKQMERFDSHKLSRIQMKVLQTDQEQDTNIPIERGLPIPEYLISVPDIEERYTKGNELLYYLVYKLAEHVGFTTEQVIGNEYKKQSPIFRDVLGLDIDVGTIRNGVAGHVCDLFVSCIDIDLKIDEDDATHDLLLILMRAKTQHIMRSLAKIVGNLEFVQTVRERMTLLKAADDRSITRLLGDIKGMYHRSKVPEFERPFSGGCGPSKRLNEKVATTLLDKVKEVKGLGYRYDKLHVYINDQKDSEEKEEIEKAIKETLVKHNISDYIVSTERKTVTHYMEVGDRIRVTRSGTLGGFAIMGQHTLCALLSQHVVNGASDVFLETDNVKIGCMITAQDVFDANIGYVDVAAAKIINKNQQDLDTRFKDSQGRSLISCLCEFNNEDIQNIQSLPVHMCGASTKFGKGTITIPEYFVRDENDSVMARLVLIEDIDEDETIQRFCREGDSGAVICADTPDGDYIVVISMLIGSKNYEEFQADPSKTGEYVSFRMTNGLQKLHLQTGLSFTLCS